MLDEAVGAAEARRAGEDTQLGGDGHRVVTPSAHLEREHPRAAAHLLSRERMCGMTREPRIVHGLDTPVAFEECRQGHRVARMRAYAPRQRLDAAQHEPAIEWRWHTTARGLHGADARE